MVLHGTFIVIIAFGGAKGLAPPGGYSWMLRSIAPRRWLAAAVAIKRVAMVVTSLIAAVDNFTLLSNHFLSVCIRNLQYFALLINSLHATNTVNIITVTISFASLLNCYRGKSSISERHFFLNIITVIDNIIIKKGINCRVWLNTASTVLAIL